MKTIIELDAKDIKEAIAAKFGCGADQVDLEAERTCVGYGMGEHYENRVIARIDKSRTSNYVATNLTATGAHPSTLSSAEWNSCHTDLLACVSGEILTKNN